ncbi:hypothetical protein KEJ19_05510 [Candidatus Bathyarchaeota archaeon]|nr:hypothetical protein [Candidatus Bathyarchaeota archaeon]
MAFFSLFKDEIFSGRLCGSIVGAQKRGSLDYLNLNAREIPMKICYYACIDRKLILSVFIKYGGRF